MIYKIIVISILTVAIFSSITTAEDVTEYFSAGLLLNDRWICVPRPVPPTPPPDESEKDK